MARERFLGVVLEGLLRRLTPIRDPAGGCRLTRRKAEAGSPEDEELSMESYEGAALLVEGEAQELWIYEAQVIEKGSPIVTELVQFVLGHPVLQPDLKPMEAP
jgi:hypothetical protein